MNRTERIGRLLLGLSESRMWPGFSNPYRRREAVHNLKLFLTIHDAEARALLLVGEAPGYRGAAVSGVPLTSVSILTDPWENTWKAFGPTMGYVIPAWSRYRWEATATMVWSALADLFGELPLPLTWNAVPFHPVDRLNRSNSPLRQREVKFGVSALGQLLELFPNVVPVAIGRRASEALKLAGRPDFWEVRHPSRGGKAQFLSGLQEVRHQLGPNGRRSHADSLLPASALHGMPQGAATI